MDVLCYSKDNKIVGVTKFSVKLHSAIFTSSYWGTCKMLKKTKDFYKTSLSIFGNDIEEFILDLKNIKTFLEEEYIVEIDILIDIVSKNDIFNIKFIGD